MSHLHGQQIPQGTVLLTQANGMYSIRQTAFCSSSVCSFTAPVFQETTQCVSHYTADRQEVTTNYSYKSFCSTPEHYIQCSKSKFQHTHHYRSPLSSRDCLRECQWLLSVWYKLLLPWQEASPGPAEWADAIHWSAGEQVVGQGYSKQWYPGIL